MTVRSTDMKTPIKGSSLVPSWMQESIKVMARLDVWWRGLGGIVALAITALGLLLLLGGGYTSIQGLRIPIAVIARTFGQPFDADNFPGLLWWLIPFTTNLIQIFCRMFRMLRFFWWPSIIFDSVTTAVFSALAMIAVAIQLGGTYSTSVIPCGILASVLAYIISILAEKIFIGGVRLLWAAATGQ